MCGQETFSTETVILAGILFAIPAAILVAAYFDWRKQERERPHENFRGPAAIRYMKTVLMWLADGAFGAIGSL